MAEEIYTFRGKKPILHLQIPKNPHSFQKSQYHSTQEPFTQSANTQLQEQQTLQLENPNIKAIVEQRLYHRKNYIQERCNQSDSQMEMSLLEPQPSELHEDQEQDQEVQKAVRQKKQDLLKYKVNQLQKTCASLTSSNQKLLKKLQLIEVKRDQGKNANFNTSKLISSSKFNQSESQQDQLLENIKYESKAESQISSDVHFQKQIFLIEQKLSDYRKQLQKSQQRVFEQIFEKQKLNKRLSEEIQRLEAKNLVLQKRIDEIEFKNSVYRSKNYQLETQLTRTVYSKNQTSRKKSVEQKSQKRSLPKIKSQALSQSYIIDAGRQQCSEKFQDFENIVNQQLQKMIQKLIFQLETERKSKKNAFEEIKRQGKQLASKEKEIMSKNQQIYQLELSLLKSEKKNTKCFRCQVFLPSNMTPITDRSENSLPQSINYQVTERRKSTRQEHRDLRETRTRFYQNFSFIQLIDQRVRISGLQKLFVIMKTVDFFQRKLQAKNFGQVTVQDLEVINYSPKNLNMLMIRDQSRSRKASRIQLSGDPNKQNLIWNMGFVLDNLLNQVEEKDQAGKWQFRQGLSKLIEELIESQTGQHSAGLRRIKEYLMDAINQERE